LSGCYKPEGKPDLIITDIYWEPENPTTSYKGFVHYRVKVKNVGKGYARSFTVALKLNEKNVKEVVCHSLEPGEEAELLMGGDKIGEHQNLRPGTNTLRAIADYRNEVEESNEGNNERVERLVIGDYVLPLSRGWNLISSPLEQPLTLSKIEEFCPLETYEGYKMWAYDPVNNWTHPTEVNPNEGVYVYAKEDCTVVLEGKKANFTSKELKKGWNIISIGDRSLEEVKGDCKIAGKVWELKDGGWILHGINEVLNGSKGYWVRVEEDCTLGESSAAPSQPTSIIPCDSCESCNEAIKRAPKGSTILLTRNITCTSNGRPCILIDKKEDIIFDCGGQSILSSIITPDFEEDGIYINHSNNVIIKNCEINGSWEGARFHENIEIRDSSGISIKNSKLDNCYYYCVYTQNSHNSLIEGNQIHGNMKLEGGNHVIIRNNSASNIELSGNYHTIEDNKFSGGIVVRGGTSSMPVDERGHGHVIRGNKLKNSGIFLVFTNNNTIEKNEIVDTGYGDGIWLDAVRSTTLKNNIIRDTYTGVKVTRSFDISIEGNVIVSSKAEGIELNELTNGKIINNKIGWSMGGRYYVNYAYRYGYGNGISLYWGGNRNVVIEGNEICRSGYTYVPPETEPISADILVGRAFPPNENITIRGNKCNKILLNQSAMPGSGKEKSCSVPFEGECIFPEVISEITCEPDCTYNVDNRCHLDCDGINGCSFDRIVKEYGSINGKQKGTQITLTREFTNYVATLCEGIPVYMGEEDTCENKGGVCCDYSEMCKEGHRIAGVTDCPGRCCDKKENCYSLQECEPDCTYVSDNVCHPECDGINGCSFYDETAKEKCDGVSKGWVVSYNNSGYRISCCTGSPSYFPKFETHARPIVFLSLSRGWNLISSPVEEPLTLSKIEEFCTLEAYEGYKMWAYDPVNNWTHPTEVKADEGGYVYAKEDCTRI